MPCRAQQISLGSIPRNRLVMWGLSTFLSRAISLLAQVSLYVVPPWQMLSGMLCFAGGLRLDTKAWTQSKITAWVSLPGQSSSALARDFLAAAKHIRSTSLWVFLQCSPVWEETSGFLWPCWKIWNTSEITKRSWHPLIPSQPQSRWAWPSRVFVPKTNWHF